MDTELGNGVSENPGFHPSKGEVPHRETPDLANTVIDLRRHLAANSMPTQALGSPARLIFIIERIEEALHPVIDTLLDLTPQQGGFRFSPKSGVDVSEAEDAVRLGREQLSLFLGEESSEPEDYEFRRFAGNFRSNVEAFLIEGRFFIRDSTLPVSQAPRYLSLCQTLRDSIIDFRLQVGRGIAIKSLDPEALDDEEPDDIA